MGKVRISDLPSDGVFDLEDLFIVVDRDGYNKKLSGAVLSSKFVINSDPSDPTTYAMKAGSWVPVPLDVMKAVGEGRSGFIWDDEGSMGYCEYCHDAASGEVHRYQPDGSKLILTSQTYFSDGITLLTDKTFVLSKNTSDVVKFVRDGVSLESCVSGSEVLNIVVSSSKTVVALDSGGHLVEYPNLWDTFSAGDVPVCGIFNDPSGLHISFQDCRFSIKDPVRSLQRMLSSPQITCGLGFSVNGVDHDDKTFNDVSGGILYNLNLLNIFPGSSAVYSLYKSGTSGEYVRTSYRDNQINVSVSNVDATSAFNEDSGASWGLVTLPTGEYMNVFFLVVPDTSLGVVKIPGQSKYGSRSDAEEGKAGDLIKILTDPLFPFDQFATVAGFTVNDIGEDLDIGDEISTDYRFVSGVIKNIATV